MTGGRPLTGRMVLGVALGAFGVVLGVNLLLAWLAVGTFSGVVVNDRYVASRSFDADRRAQEALGWTLALVLEGDVLRLELTDAAGQPVHPETIAAVIGRPASDRADRALALEPTPARYVAEAALEPGAWALRVDAVSASGVAYHRRERLLVEPGP